jgi:hypothetical protein
MKRCIGFLFFIASAMSFAQPSIEWMRDYGAFGGDYHQQAKGVVQTSDGGFVYCGWTRVTTDMDHDVLVHKVDENGDAVWVFEHGVPILRDMGLAICPSHDDGFIVVGYTSREGLGNRDVLVLKVSSTGDLVWEQVYGNDSNEEAWDVAAIPGGGYAVTGYVTDAANNYFDAFLMKIDEAGDIVWSTEFGGDDEEWGEAVVVRPDGGFYVGEPPGPTQPIAT